MRFNVPDPHAFFETTVGLSMAGPAIERFVAEMPARARILDAGCGSGRDARAFMDRGHQVIAFDAHPDLVALARQYLGVQAIELRFEDVAFDGDFDGIWACASLLHLSPSALPDALTRLTRALAPGGTLYMSFKHGPRERVDPSGRYFNDQTAASLRALVADTPGLLLTDTFQTDDLRGRDTRWINALARRTR